MLHTPELDLSINGVKSFGAALRIRLATNKPTLFERHPLVSFYCSEIWLPIYEANIFSFLGTESDFSRRTML